MNETGNRLIRVIPPLCLLALCCSVSLVLTADWTAEGIDDNRQRASLRVIRDIIPRPYDNDPLRDVRGLDDSNLAGRDVTVSVHIAKQGDETRGFVFLPVTARGYNGPIRLAIGIHCDGSLSGVRVLQQNETEGLGAGIDQRNSDWIRQFAGESLDSVAAPEWTVAEEGGRFDGLSGATISSRAVINMIRRTLGYYATSRFNCRAG